ncbi:MAG TPA: hypothetical protein VF846_02200 [Thermoanaerobaculia bacterium]
MLITLFASIDVGAAQRGFAELQAMCAADGGRLWGRSLCGPTVFADARTREAIRSDGVATKVPDSIGIANTRVEWDGEQWTMLMWPLTQNVPARRALLAHESFHRIQSGLGFPMNNPANAHLETAEARAWMRLEWRALARALATGDERAVADALAFRAKRFIEEERQLEMNEGLAEYTGWAMAVPNVRERIPSLVRKLANAEKNETYSRAFAYASGPAWGTLLEMKKPRWTRSLKPTDDLGALARRAWNIRGTELRVSEYGGEAIRVEEEARATKKRELAAKLRARFVDGPVLRIPLQKMQFTFDPNNVQPLEGHGTVYPTLEVRDVWGKIVVTGGGALMSPDYQTLIVSANAEGYELTLADGWRLADAPRAGDKTLTNDAR